MEEELTAQDIPQETRYPIDVENVAEMARLARQARAITITIGLLPAEIELDDGQSVLDIGCGPGEWVLALAKLHPDTQISGIDISKAMTQHARSLAQKDGIPNAHFRVMDATRSLVYADASFDLAHARIVSSFLSPILWRQLLRECYRVLKPGGIFVGVESDDVGSSNSPSLSRLMSLFMSALQKADFCFTRAGEHCGIVPMYPYLLKEVGFSGVRREPLLLDYSYGAPAYAEMTQNWAISYNLMKPFLERLTGESQDALEALRQRAIKEMQAPDFCAAIFLQRIWARKAARENGDN
ncbi:class I SAM-dependent methyltransferase [Ktedonosporobacter rubrisoli]|uniref:Class I SAM-dependent methyltransferase n=1 Tax=Ktedonosporobacter rubrisoli TaxID=2509675 RepID=A0A4P6K6C8_KTERU|nr:class I SAM-dependent methyltransferase [Ktedonosporobacter rubrisoli]QBD83146.1 class I SAM-dependent methyltransferase [Ktedonosporobacter rubrisoli]